MSLVVILTISIVTGVTYQIFADEPINVATFPDNFLKNLDGNEVFVLIQILVILAGIWLIGGTAGRRIIDKNNPKFLTGALTFFLLWVLLFTSSTLTAAIENSMIWGQKGFGSAVTGWIIYGLFLFLIFGIVHGLTMGYFMGREIKRKGEKIKSNTPRTAIGNGV